MQKMTNFHWFCKGLSRPRRAIPSPIRVPGSTQTFIKPMEKAHFPLSGPQKDPQKEHFWAPLWRPFGALLGALLGAQKGSKKCPFGSKKLPLWRHFHRFRLPGRPAGPGCRGFPYQKSISDILRGRLGITPIGCGMHLPPRFKAGPPGFTRIQGESR